MVSLVVAVAPVSAEPLALEQVLTVFPQPALR
jgi:hypothetical protein